MTRRATEERIAKILALAANNPNKNEAIAALLKAKTLMEGDATIILPHSDWINKYFLVKDNSAWFARLGLLLAPLFRMRFLAGSKTGNTYLYGYLSDVDLARKSILLARKTAIKLAANWWSDNIDYLVEEPEPWGVMDNYLVAYVEGLKNKLEEAGSTGTLAITQRMDDVDKALAQEPWGVKEYPGLQASESPRAFEEGYAAGREGR